MPRARETATNRIAVFIDKINFASIPGKVFRKTNFPAVIERNLFNRHAATGITPQSAAFTGFYRGNGKRIHVAPGRKPKIGRDKPHLHEGRKSLVAHPEGEIPSADIAGEVHVAPPLGIAVMAIGLVLVLAVFQVARIIRQA